MLVQCLCQSVINHSHSSTQVHLYLGHTMAETMAMTRAASHFNSYYRMLLFNFLPSKVLDLAQPLDAICHFDLRL